MENITAIIVSYNTKELLNNCYDSIRKFYPELKIIIIDGSHHTNPCFEYSKNLKEKNRTMVFNVERNIGHGKGMKMGIALCNTKYFLLIDSDIIMNAPPLDSMLQLLEENIYGIGQVIKVDDNGSNSEVGIPYLHPHFALINLQLYKKHDGIIHHGAPMLKAMKDLHKNKLNFLMDFPIENYITHLGRGTRILNPPEFLKNWES